MIRVVKEIGAEKMKNILAIVLWLLGLAIGILAIILAIMLVSSPITNLTELNRYLAAITLFCGGLVIVIDRMRTAIEMYKQLVFEDNIKR